MIRLILRWVFGLTDSTPYRITRVCDCGQESSGVCTKRMRIAGDGILEQQRDVFLRCGHTKRQIRALRGLNE